MPIVGTAGHVDHGKSTLVEALTGRDPDRWDEEKVRGLTIDLGFAWTELRPGVIAGFVDVPGHERFMKNMLAGVGALDVALFVVAADELWMPQTEEHLAVLDLLDVRHGVIAMTRADLADADMIELGQLEIQEKVAGTTLEGWPISVVSAVSGLGIEQLRVNLAQAIDNAGPPLNIGRPRLWVDRSFVISGAGVVVTGTLAGRGTPPRRHARSLPRRKSRPGPRPAKSRTRRRERTPGNPYRHKPGRHRAGGDRPGKPPRRPGAGPGDEGILDGHPDGSWLQRGPHGARGISPPPRQWCMADAAPAY